MNWKKQCAALGIPDLPEGAFEHVGDRKIKPQGGGGGGGQPANTTQTSIPEYAKPYVQNMLGAAQGQIYNFAQNGQGGWDITGLKPYQPYTGQLTAGPSTLQNRSYDAAYGMSASPYIGQGADMAKNAGLAALQNSQYNPTSYDGASFDAGKWNSQAAQEYMNPYQQGVVDVAKREALRDAAIQNTQRAAKFSQAGAFGGSRQAIADAEASRNLNQNLSDIQTKGMADAYNTGLQAFQQDANRDLQAQQLGEQSRQYGAGLTEQSRQFGANLGLQGLQQQLAAAQTMGQLGAAQTQAGIDIAKMQNEFGTQQQQTAQQALDAQQAQWAAAQNYPYKQLGFLSDMLRGLPLSNTSVYQASPSPTSQLAGLGLAGLGLYNSMK